MAMKELNYTALPGASAPMRIMWVQRDPTSRRAAVGNVVVKNLPPTGVDAKTISDLFGAFGTVVSVRLPTDEAGKTKGYGFVQFDTEAAAKACITDLTGMELAGRSIVVEPYVRYQDRQKGCVWGGAAAARRAVIIRGVWGLHASLFNSPAHSLALSRPVAAATGRTAT